MSNRFWFYLGVAIVIVGLFSYRTGVRNKISNDINRINLESRQAALSDLSKYLEKQTDERKLVSLAKKLRNRESWLLEAIIDRAYAINPKSRDITLLASEFHPELKEKVKILDPLYKE